jgi:hypothetical protein
VLDLTRRRLGLSVADLWLRYFALGGMRSRLEVEAFLGGAPHPDAHNRALLVTALNERSQELGERARLPYADEDDRGSGR